MASMLVDVVFMRREGVKIAREVVLRAQPIRGHLAIKTRNNPSIYPGQPPTITTATLSRVPGGAGDIAWLEPAMLKRQVSDQLIVLGRESYGNPGMQRSWPQA